MSDMQNNEELIRRINELQSELSSVKKYGLRWDKEKIPENVVIECISKIPVVCSIADKDIVNSGLDNIIIEGDNFHSLMCLKMIGQELFDFVYIDPPYNTGKTTDDSGFKYNDNYVDKDDTYRHSKWLNMMEKRLSLARDLMKDTAPIFISIDDNECFDLKLLCDNVFGSSNFIAVLPTIMNLKGNNDQFGFSGTHEYTIVYCKNINECVFSEFSIDEEDILDEWNKDSLGYFKKGATLKSTGIESNRTDRPYCFYPFLIKNGKLSMILDEEYEKLYDESSGTFDDSFLDSIKKKYEAQGFGLVLPSTKSGDYGRWRWGFEKSKNDIGEIIVTSGRNDVSLYKKQRPQLGDLPTKKPKSVFYKPEYSSGNGTSQLNEVIGKNNFNNPKPLQLIKDFITIGCPKDGLILDFFAGSGTTGHAILEMNNEDATSARKFILLQNNESRILDDVTYPRIKTVIDGIRADGTKYSNGVRATVHYFKTDFIKDEDNSDQAKYSLVEKVDSLICIREGIFTFAYRNDYSSHYSSVDKQKNLFIYNDFYDENKFLEFKNRVCSTVGEKIVYIFTTDNKLDDSLFDDTSIIQKPIPSKIYEIYKEISENIKRGA